MPARADPCQTCRAQEPVTHREPCWPSVVCPKESPSAKLQPMLARGSRARAAPKCLEKRNEKCLDRVKNSLIEFKRLAYTFVLSIKLGQRWRASAADPVTHRPRLCQRAQRLFSFRFFESWLDPAWGFGDLGPQYGSSLIQFTFLRLINKNQICRRIRI
jgi:hypothetical protein